MTNKGFDLSAPIQLSNEMTLIQKIQHVREQGKQTILKAVEDELLKVIEKYPFANDFSVCQTYDKEMREYILDKLRDQLPQGTIISWNHLGTQLSVVFPK
jgi:hypothetical protein